jgi:hypothetical protein
MGSTTRSPEQLIEYISKLGYLAREIKADHSYKRPERTALGANTCRFVWETPGKSERL